MEEMDLVPQLVVVEASVATQVGEIFSFNAIAKSICQFLNSTTTHLKSQDAYKRMLHITKNLHRWMQGEWIGEWIGICKSSANHVCCVCPPQLRPPDHGFLIEAWNQLYHWKIEWCILSASFWQIKIMSPFPSPLQTTFFLIRINASGRWTPSPGHHFDDSTLNRLEQQFSYSSRKLANHCIMGDNL